MPAESSWRDEYSFVFRTRAYARTSCDIYVYTFASTSRSTRFEPTTASADHPFRTTFVLIPAGNLSSTCKFSASGRSGRVLSVYISLASHCKALLPSLVSLSLHACISRAYHQVFAFCIETYKYIASNIIYSIYV